MGDDIKQMVDAVAEVDIGGSSRAKHDFCPFGAPVLVGMASFIFGSFVGFRLGDDSSCDDAIK